MIKVDVEESGVDFAAEIRGLMSLSPERIAKTATHALGIWHYVVISTTWFHPHPSPSHLIKMSWGMEAGDLVIEYGWTDRSGGNPKARARMRKDIAEPMMLEFIGKALEPGGG